MVSESIYAWNKLFSSLGLVLTSIRTLRDGEDDGMLIRADKGANSAGAAITSMPAEIQGAGG